MNPQTADVDGSRFRFQGDQELTGTIDGTDSSLKTDKPCSVLSRPQAFGFVGGGETLTWLEGKRVHSSMQTIVSVLGFGGFCGLGESPHIRSE